MVFTIICHLQSLRWKAKLSQEQLANICEVSRSTITAIENGRRTPSVEIALKLAKALSVTVEELFSLK